MKLKAIILIAIALAAGVGIPWAIQTYSYPQQFTVGEIQYNVYVNGTSWGNNTVTDWGTVYPGNTYSYNLTVQSTVPSNTTCWIVTVGLPANYTQTWTANMSRIEPMGILEGWLNLTIPKLAVPGNYTCTSTIHGEYS